jgi:Tat protein secretion system quality control protein TatD with DNase activity
MREQLVDQQELETVRNYILGQFLRSVDGPFALADKFKSIWEFGLDYSFFDHYFSSVQNVTAEEIRDLASRKKIFLFHASGHVASAYLAEKLKDEKFSAFDIGMSFDWLLKDILDEEPTACERSSCWSRNCDSKELKNYIKQLRK